MRLPVSCTEGRQDQRDWPRVISLVSKSFRITANHRPHLDGPVLAAPRWTCITDSPFFYFGGVDRNTGKTSSSIIFDSIAGNDGEKTGTVIGSLQESRSRAACGALGTRTLAAWVNRLLLTSGEFFRAVGFNDNINLQRKQVDRKMLMNWFLFVFLQCCYRNWN